MKFNSDSIKNVFKSANITITLCNIIFFMIVQTFFFKYIASKQFNIVLQNKMGIMTELAKNNIYVNNKIKEYKDSNSVASIKINAEKENKAREKKNSMLMLKEFGPFIGGCFIILLFFIIMMLYYNIFKKDNNWHKWMSVDTSILTLVLFAYTTELLFYFGIVRNYDFYGDQQLYDKLYYNVKENVVILDTDDIPITESISNQIGNQNRQSK
jgi:hypothetical protein